MKALITGGNGFAAQHLARHLIERGDEVVVTIRSGNLNRHNLVSHRIVELAIENLEQCAEVVRSEVPDVIYHLAAVTFVPAAEKDPEWANRLNVDAARALLVGAKAVRRMQSIRFVGVSSSEIFGSFVSEELPLSEATEPRPRHVYGHTKVALEELVLSCASVNGVTGVVARPFNHIGPGQRESFVVSSFASQLAQISLGRIPPILRVGNLEARRDFTDVRDIVRGYRLLAEQGEGVYHFCSGQSVAISHVLNRLIEISGVAVTVEQDPQRMRPSEVPEIRGDFSRARRELGWAPEIPLDVSLKDCFHFWMTHYSQQEAG